MGFTAGRRDTSVVALQRRPRRARGRTLARISLQCHGRRRGPFARLSRLPIVVPRARLCSCARDFSGAGDSGSRDIVSRARRCSCARDLSGAGDSGSRATSLARETFQARATPDHGAVQRARHLVQSRPMKDERRPGAAGQVARCSSLGRLPPVPRKPTISRQIPLSLPCLGAPTAPAARGRRSMPVWTLPEATRRNDSVPPVPAGHASIDERRQRCRSPSDSGFTPSCSRARAPSGAGSISAKRAAPIRSGRPTASSRRSPSSK